MQPRAEEDPAAVVDELLAECAKQAASEGAYPKIMGYRMEKNFGLAKAFSQAGMTKGGVTAPGTVSGSRPNMAPEHLMNYRYIELCTDVFEMAASFHHMFTGAFVWEFRPNVDPLRVILEDTPKPIRSHEPALPEPVAAVLDQALSRDRTARHQDAGAFLTALKNAL